MLKTQVRAMQLWNNARTAAHDLTANDRDRGEVTAQTALIVVLVGAAIAAGGAIAVAMANNTGNIPTP